MATTDLMATKQYLSIDIIFNQRVVGWITV